MGQSTHSQYESRTQEPKSIGSRYCSNNQLNDSSDLPLTNDQHLNFIICKINDALSSLNETINPKNLSDQTTQAITKIVNYFRSNQQKLVKEIKADSGIGPLINNALDNISHILQQGLDKGHYLDKLQQNIKDLKKHPRVSREAACKSLTYSNAIAGGIAGFSLIAAGISLVATGGLATLPLAGLATGLVVAGGLLTTMGITTTATSAYVSYQSYQASQDSLTYHLTQFWQAASEPEQSHNIYSNKSCLPRNCQAT